MWFRLHCIMQLKWSYYIATNVWSRKSATTFGDLRDCWGEIASSIMKALICNLSSYAGIDTLVQGRTHFRNLYLLHWVSVFIRHIAWVCCGNWFGYTSHNYCMKQPQTHRIARPISIQKVVTFCQHAIHCCIIWAFDVEYERNENWMLVANCYIYCIQISSMISVL